MIQELTKQDCAAGNENCMCGSKLEPNPANEKELFLFQKDNNQQSTIGLET